MTHARTNPVVAALGFALLLGSGCEDPEPALHGYVKIQLLRAENQKESPFGGTDTIKAIVRYVDATSQCLGEFYAANPNWKEDGLDGGPVFTEWEQEKLCGGIKDEDGPVDCTVVDIRQFFDDEAAPQMQLTYSGVSGTIENRVLLVGPLPTEELATCEGVAQPIVSITAPGITGTGSGGAQVWSGSSAPVDKAFTGQGAPMKVRAARN